MNNGRPQIRMVDVTRYITPLREGGSLPAIVEADDDFLYVLKFRGAGQGVKALIAELLGGEIARALGFRVPEIVFANVDPAFGRTEPDEEIQDLLKFSEGLNLALHYLSGAISFDPTVVKMDELVASQVVWLDCFITNVDRTARNTNMLMWHKELWLIDHGASLYFHHSWTNWEEQSIRPFGQVGAKTRMNFRCLYNSTAGGSKPSKAGWKVQFPDWSAILFSGANTLKSAEVVGHFSNIYMTKSFKPFLIERV